MQIFTFNTNLTPSPEDTALMLSNTWKDRIIALKQNFQKLIKDLQVKIETLSQENKYDIIDKTVDEICTLQFYVNEIKDMKINGYPLSPSVIERITFFENEYYKRIMTPEILKTLNEEAYSSEMLQRLTPEIIATTDEMWDDNKSEEDIKAYIRNMMKKIYRNFPDEDIEFITEETFINLTVQKPVRINLSDNEIQKLERCKGISSVRCGTCLEEIEKNEEIIKLTCHEKHVFHPDCIIPWLKRNVHCPICRSDLRNGQK